MTGYGSATRGAFGTPPTGAAVTVELRSVNGRFLDLALRLPDELRALEPALRELVGAHLRRGKVELRVSAQRETADAMPQPGAGQLHRLAQLESMVHGWLPKAAPLSVHEAMQWCRGSAAPAGLEEAALAAAQEAARALVQTRAREGERLAAVLRERVEHLRGLATQVAPLLPQVVHKQQQRFLERWQEALTLAGSTVPAQTQQERALAEAAAFAIRIDVAEELARLMAHLDEVDRLLERGGELGKRLDFLIQELHREANTLGSKSAALELTAIALDMKVAIEQMKEQVQNLE